MSRNPEFRAFRRPITGLALLLVAFVASGAACGQVGQTGPRSGAAVASTAPKNGGEMAPNPRWEEVDRLISEDKMAAAVEIAAEILAAARESGDEEEQTRALIKQVQLRTGLHGYETAVRFLKDEPWPEGPIHRAVLNLFYGHSLVTYLRSYSWEIRQRERLDTGEEIDLKAWTQEQIADEVQRAYSEAWSGREAWGSESLGVLAEYLEQNTYPARIRGTLRDAVTHLWGDHLENTSLWRPEHDNERYRLDFEAMAGDDPEPVALDDPEVHPLLKLTTIFADLERWHHERRQPEAAFHARLVRVHVLWHGHQESQVWPSIRQSLEDGLDRLGRRYEWWSWGQARLALWVRDHLNDQVEARRIALAGLEAHPESPGGLLCRNLVAQIEAPSYTVTGMAIDNPGRRSILVEHRNLEKIYFRAYAVDLRQRVEQARDYNLLPGHRDVPALMASKTPVAEWATEVPATPDFEQHRTYVTPPLEAPGLYVVVASARRDFASSRNQQSAINMIVGDLVLLTRSHETESEITVRSGESGRPQAGVKVDLYRANYRQSHQLVESRITGDDGVAQFAGAAFARGNHFVLAQRGDQVALVQNLRRPYQANRSSARTSALIYTDRSVYRPQQKILWKTVAYRGGDFSEAERAQRPSKASSVEAAGRFEIYPEAELKMELVDANGEVVASAEATTNRYGSASGEFEIPAGRLLGGWRLQSSIGGSTSVRVEEYKRPTFEVEVVDPESPLRLNREATLTGEVRYYFGLPVVTGEVAWRVTREPVYPRWGWYRWAPQRGATQTLAAGETWLDAEGRFRVTFTPEADEQLSKQVSYRYRLSVDVTDEGGETHSASRAFRLGFVAVEAALDADTTFFRQGEPAEITIRRTDLDGVPRAGEGAWKLVSLVQPERALLPAEQPTLLAAAPGGEADPEDFSTPGDHLNPRWAGGSSPQQVMTLWADGSELRGGEVEHGGNGEAAVPLTGLAAGAYRLRYTTTDAFGAEYETARELVVVGEQTPLALPTVLMAERSSVSVGEVARFFVHSGLENQEMLLEVYRAGRRVERRPLESGELIEIPVEPAHRGGFSLQLSSLRDHQLMTFRRDVFVPWDDRRLQIEFATFRDRLRPGDEETWRVVVKGHDDEALGRGAAEVLAYMYDRSLDVFAPHRPVDPIRLYPSRVGAPGVQSTLGVARRAWQQSQDFIQLPEYPTFSGDRLKFFDGYGIGGPGRRRRGEIPKPKSARAAPSRVQGMVAEDGVFVESVDAVAAAPVIAESASAAAYSAEPAEPEPAGEPPPEEPVELRTDFSETAFWEPHLVIGEDGSVAFEFTVPDSVTEWNVWLHAVTRDLRGGSLQQQAKTVKELLVRPYLPRFFREGDRAELEVVVNNAGESELSGVLDFEIIDPETEESLLSDFGLASAAASGVSFTVAPGGGTSLTFPVKAPPRVGQVAFRVIGRAGDLSDGELRPLPVLPGRLHLAQSRFVTLHDEDRRTLEFEDLRAEDPTRIDEQLVVTLDAQLFYSVLHSLPYLADYPYECTEQLLNRFLSTGIVSSLYEDYPAVARMAKEFSARETVLEPWDADDPNRKMALEETPWLRQSRGGPDPHVDLINVLDPEIAGAQREASLAKLQNAQTSLGGFPWWPGGPPSPYMTLYLLQGFSRALEFDVEVPRDMVVRAWSYMHRHYLDQILRDMQREDCCWETVTYLNFILSSFPDTSWTGGVFTDDERRKMLEFSFTHWRKHSPRLKGYLALTLQRAGRDEDARLVFDSVMDSAKTTRDEGTFWAPEDRAWLWYNDTIETHAFALRTLTELGPDDARRHGLVQWLLLNKKLNHWKSTRATAEVIYSLVHYLEREGTLGVKEEATVSLGDRRQTFTWEPDRYVGKSQLVVLGDDIDPHAMSTIEVAKETPGFMFASATWHFSTEKLPDEARGDFFAVTRRYFKRVNTGREWTLQPLAEGAALEPGDQLEVQISLRAKHAAEYVHLRDPRGAGFEPETTTSSYKWNLGIGWYEEVRDSGTNFFFEWLPAGEYTFKYRLRANLAGTFRVGPATVQSMYAPEFVGYSAGAELGIESGD